MYVIVKQIFALGEIYISHSKSGLGINVVRIRFLNPQNLQYSNVIYYLQTLTIK